MTNLETLLSPRCELIDTHIDAALKLVSSQLGLSFQSCLLQQTDFFPIKDNNHVQIHHIGCSTEMGRWIVSQFNSGEKEVLVFDSLNPPYLSPDLVAQLRQLYQNPNERTHISIIEVQQQPNVIDCGLFAIANAFEIVSGNDPAYAVYNNDLMRAHLANTFDNENEAEDEKIKKIIPFPKDQSKKNTVKSQRVVLVL